ncbi:alpha/beta hydrolase [Lysinibacillus sp. JK80]|uniref:alpha/beta hydrolase n=1 Tax=Lysinibacillus sp. JK80 TaxID=2749809 RepID=UPI0022B967D3|nr:alpha/beta hydrolase [Lysinibacillus sp. JK80]WBF55226.1 alpha/beta hydrolase [Lysinibacillus sp. JK80]
MITLRKEAVQYLEAQRTGTPYYKVSPQEARAMRTVTQWQSAHKPKLASIEDHKITVRDGEQITVRLYTPVLGKTLPVIVYYHGGGWVYGNLESVDVGCQLLADQAQAIVVSVDYRLAPEYPFPTPLHDAYDSLVWVHDHMEALGGDASRLSVAGDSAGGNLATVVAYLATALEGPSLHAQTLIYPVTNVDFSTVSYLAYGEDYGLDTQAMQWFSHHYTEEANFTNPLVSPLQLEEVRNMPKTFIIAAEADVLFDEGLSYAQKLKAAGVVVEHITMPGLIHSYFSKMNYFEEATIETVTKIAQFLK